MDLVSVYCDWVRQKVWSAASISVWQQVKLSSQIHPWDTWQQVKLSSQIHPWDTWQQVKLSSQIHPWDTVACCWDLKQPTDNKQQQLANHARKRVSGYGMKQLTSPCWPSPCRQEKVFVRISLTSSRLRQLSAKKNVVYLGLWTWRQFEFSALSSHSCFSVLCVPY